MASLSKNFRVFLSNIEPPEARRKTAQDMPAKVRDYLQKHEELTTVSPHTRLAGSYRRQTANGEIKDVDVIVFVSDDYKDDIDALLKLLHSVLLELPDELDDCGEVSLRKQRRSIRVHLEKHDLFIDIVPVRFTTDKTTDVLLIPDREWSKWVNTQPLGYADSLSTLNGDHEDKVVPLVKMFKHWRSEKFERRCPKSYWLESLIVRHINCDYVSTEDKGYGEIVADLFESIYTCWEKTWKETTNVPKIPDAMLGNNVAWNWERSHFETFMRRVEDCKGWTRRAVNETDETKAVELWQKVFGLDFPVSSLAEATVKGWELGEASKNGTASVSATGLVSAVAGLGVQAPPTRFYGDDIEA